MTIFGGAIVFQAALDPLDYWFYQRNKGVRLLYSTLPPPALPHLATFIAARTSS